MLLRAPRRDAPAAPPRPAPDETHMLTYEPFYGLQEPAFSASTDPKFFYHSVSHDRVAQDLLSAIRGRESVVVVTGEAGTGKTMLCRAVTEQLDRRTLTSIVGAPFASIEQLLKTVLIDFGVMAREEVAAGRLARASAAELSTTLREFLFSLGALEAFAVVVIDDAHTMTADMLEDVRALSELDGGANLLQVVLVGEPVLLRQLARSATRSLLARATVQRVVEPLEDDAEVADYVLHRLTVCGSKGGVDFADGAIERLYVLSEGIPRDINRLCDAALRLGREQSATVIDRPLIDRAAADVGIAPPASRAVVALRIAAVVIAFLSLMLVGAAVGAIVFHDRFAQLIGRWEAVPAAPRALTPRQPRPLAPLPPPAVGD